MTAGFAMLTLLVTVQPGEAFADTGTVPVVTPLGLVADEVSHDGQALPSGVVRDNPALQVVIERQPRPIRRDEDYYRRGTVAGVYLLNTSTGSRVRIDTDSSGAPLVPSWSDDRPCGNEWCDSFYEVPDVFVSSESVSRDGRRVAFCSNYLQPKVPTLYVKDTVTGRLTKTGLRCPVIDTAESLYTRAPQISANGRVVHVKGDATEQDYLWSADHLYFTRSGTTRTVNGWGSMTRDGGTIFMRLGVRRTPTAVSRVRVGAYSVKTRRVVRLSGEDRIYGNLVDDFSAFDSASYRGRFVVARALIWVGHTSTDSRVSVVDRRSGATTDLAALVRQQGYEPSQGDWRPFISGDGKVVFVAVATGTSPSAEENMQTVAITGWEPTARAAVSTNAAQSKLVVNVDPDKGSGSWTIRVQAKRADGTWRTLKKSYRTQGRKETRTIDLPAGTYRVVVKAKYGYLGSTSAEVTLVR